MKGSLKLLTYFSRYSWNKSNHNKTAIQQLTLHNKNDLIYAKFSEKERVTSKKDSIAFVSNLRLMNSQGDTNWLPQLAVPNKLISGVTFLPENTGLYYCLCVKVNLMEVRCDIYFRKFND